MLIAFCARIVIYIASRKDKVCRSETNEYPTWWSQIYMTKWAVTNEGDKVVVGNFFLPMSLISHGVETSKSLSSMVFRNWAFSALFTCFEQVCVEQMNMQMNIHCSYFFFFFSISLFRSNWSSRASTAKQKKKSGTKTKKKRTRELKKIILPDISWTHFCVIRTKEQKIILVFITNIISVSPRHPSASHLFPNHPVFIF